MTQNYVINEANISHDRLEGEVIIVDLSSGSYFSTSLVGADIWTLVSSKVDKNKIIEELSNIYKLDILETKNQIECFITELINNNLIKEVDLNEDFPINLPQDIVRLKWENPRLEKYTDMWDLIKMDPIHETDTDIGWPEKKKSD